MSQCNKGARAAKPFRVCASPVVHALNAPEPNDKSLGNKLKHGINFDEARELWRDPDRAPALAGQEPRFVAIEDRR